MKFLLFSKFKIYKAEVESQLENTIEILGSIEVGSIPLMS